MSLYCVYCSVYACANATMGAYVCSKMAQDVASEVLERMDGGKDGEGGGLGTNTATLFT